MRRIALFAILIAGCRSGTKPPAAPGSTSTPAASAPAQFSDLPAGDTAAVLAMMRQTMRGIDAGLGAMTRRDTTLAAVADSAARHLTLWLENGVPRKLTSVADSSSNGPTDGETDLWFVGGDVAVVQRVADSYALDAGRIVLWTDESLLPRSDITPDQVMARETELISTARNWLAAFGLQLP